MYHIIRISKQNFKDWYLIPFVVMFSRIHVKEIEGKLVGFALYGLKKLHYIAVDKQFLSLGIGSDMFKEIQHKISYLKVEPHNEKAKKFFMSKGFVPKGRADHPLFGPRILMVRKD